MKTDESTEKTTTADSDDSDSLESGDQRTGGVDTEAGDVDSGAGEGDVAPKNSKPSDGPRISISVRSLALGVLITALVAGLAVMTWLYIGATRDYDAQLQQVRDNEHAEQVALDYAVGAAIMDYKDLAPWRQALVEGTTDELGKKLTEAATAMEQILLPLEWASSAEPIAAKVRSHENGVYVVDAFVSVMTKTIQAEQDLRSTATYAVTIDPANGWKISDVGGIGQAVGDK